MSAGSISLESAIRTCKVDTAWSNRVQSDRFLNPENMVCPIWNGVDTAGRSVCPDSFYTKNAGCNSADDRVVVENSLRPQYMEYINLSAQGIDGGIYGNTLPWQAAGDRTRAISNVNKITGNFGKDFGSYVIPGCSMNTYNKGMAQEQQSLREQQALQEGFRAYNRRSQAGF
jgi:hypothetical protein